MTGTRALALAAILLLVGATRALAGDTQAEFAPELDAYLKLSDRTRWFFLGSLSQGLSESSTTGLVGAHLDITLMPILRRQLQDADWERERYLWVPIGYQQGLGNLDVDRDDRRVEHRGVLEANTRVPLPYRPASRSRSPSTGASSPTTPGRRISAPPLPTSTASGSP